MVWRGSQVGEPTCLVLSWRGTTKQHDWSPRNVRPTSKTCTPPPTTHELSQRAGVINWQPQSYGCFPFGQDNLNRLCFLVGSDDAPRFFWLLGILWVVRCIQASSLKPQGPAWLLISSLTSKNLKKKKKRICQVIKCKSRALYNYELVWYICENICRVMV